MGIATISKFTWLTLFIAWPVVWAIRRMIVNKSGNSAPPAIHLGLILLIATYCINACYCFDGFGTRLGEFAFVSEALGGTKAFAAAGNRFQGTFVESVPIPFPRQFVLGIDSQKRDFEHSATPSYFCGEWKNGGWWYYYIYGAVVKTPLGTLVLLGIAFGTMFAGRDSLPLLKDEIVLLTPAIIVLVLVSSQVAFNAHLRYAFPSLAFALIVTARVTCFLRGRLRWIIATCLLCTVVSTLSTYPHHLSYFNEIAGGPRNGYRHLLGSSFDWGQDLLSLRRFIAELPPGTRVAFSGPTGCSLNALGIDVDTRPLHWPLDTESPGFDNTIVIVSAALVGTDGYTDAVFDDTMATSAISQWNSRLNSNCLHVLHAPAIDLQNLPQSPSN